MSFESTWTRATFFSQVNEIQRKMTDPLEVLRHEHRTVRRGLRSLEDICSRFEQGEKVPPETVSQLLDFICTYTDCFHHGKEEDLLIPALVAHGLSPGDRPICCVLRDHELERRLIAELGRAAEAYQKEVSDEAGRLFAEIARQYLEVLTLHLWREDEMLFRVAEDLLDDRALLSLSEAFDRLEERLGPNLHDKYEQIAAELEKHQPCKQFLSPISELRN